VSIDMYACGGYSRHPSLLREHSNASSKDIEDLEEKDQEQDDE